MPLTEELEKAVLAVRLVVLFFEGSFVELLEAEGTDKVFGVKFLAHSSDAASRDRLLAPRAERAAALVVMHLAVGLPVMLKEAAVDEGRETFLQKDKAEGGGLYHKLGLQGQLHEPPLCAVAQPGCAPSRGTAAFQHCPVSQKAKFCPSRSVSKERLMDRYKPQARELTMPLPPAGFTSTKKIQQMSYHVCPVQRKENTPSPEMGNTAAPFPWFFSFPFSSNLTPASPEHQAEAGTNTTFHTFT